MKGRFTEAVRYNLAVVEETEEVADDRTKWRWSNAPWRPLTGEAERKREIRYGVSIFVN